MTGTEIVIIVAAVMTGSLVKSVTGMGLPAIAIPVIALFVPPEDAVAVMALPGVASNSLLAAREVGHRHETRDLVRFAAAAAVATPIGTALLFVLPDRVLLAVLLMAVTFYVVRFFRQPDLALAPATSRRWAPVTGFAAGLMQGATGISGPIVVTWFHAYRLARTVYILSVTTVFLVGAAVQLASLVADGRMSGLWAASLAAVVPTVAVIPLGTRLRAAFTGVVFDRVVLAVLTLSALGLLARILFT